MYVWTAPLREWSLDQPVRFNWQFSKLKEFPYGDVTIVEEIESPWINCIVYLNITIKSSWSWKLETNRRFEDSSHILH